MDCLIDTNTILRRYVPGDRLYPLAHDAIHTLLLQRHRLFIAPQILIEMRAVVTRPIEANGLGMMPTEARDLLRLIERDFPMLPETPDIYPLWRGLVDAYGVVGRQVYDARLVAVMLAHGMTRLLTFNAAHFRRFSEITVVTPGEILPAP